MRSGHFINGVTIWSGSKKGAVFCSVKAGSFLPYAEMAGHRVYL